MECTYWKYNTSRHVGKGLALLIKGKRMGFNRFNLIVFIMIGMIKNLALIVDYIS